MSARIQQMKKNTKNLCHQILRHLIEYLVKRFSEGLAGVREGIKWGFINKFGEVEIPFIYDSVENFKDGIAFVEIKYEKFYINKLVPYL